MKKPCLLFPPPSEKKKLKNEFEIQGTPVSAGIGIGKAFFAEKTLFRSGESRSPAEEKKRYDRATEKFAESAEKEGEKLKTAVSEKDGEILFAHASLACDSFVRDAVHKEIEGGMSAEAAAQAVWHQWKEALEMSSDEYVRERASDTEDVLSGILLSLQGEEGSFEIPNGCILVCDTFTPSLAAKSSSVSGVIARKGGETSHGAILARAMGLPCIFGADTKKISAGQEIICDGECGVIIVSPFHDTVKKYERLRMERLEAAACAEKYAFLPVMTSDGRKISVEANAGNLGDVERAAKSGCDGIGLFRTEFLFLERNEPPTEDEQYSVYSRAAALMGGRPVTVRTLDVGGDKKIPYLSFPAEDNPFLGLRGIRFSLKEKDLFKTQLRAVLRASAKGNIKILLPMITDEREVFEAKEAIEACKRELADDGKAFSEKTEVGIMIETPAAALCAGELSRCADFFSVGTNDLVQYVTACDRGNENVSYLYDPMSKGVKIAVDFAVSGARKGNIPCHICGEAASDGEFLDYLKEIGAGGVSVSPWSVAQVKYRLICGEK